MLITGGAGGMGLAFAERYHAAGAIWRWRISIPARLAEAARTVAPGCLTHADRRDEG